MTRIKKRIAASVMIFILLASAVCTGCSRNDGTGGSADENDTIAKGRYLETEYALPDNIGQIYAMETLENGTVRMVGGMGVYDSADGGESWELSLMPEVYERIKEGDTDLAAAAIDKEGNMFLAEQNLTSSMAIRYTYVTADGQESQVEIERPGELIVEVETAFNEKESGDDEEHTEISEEERDMYTTLYENMTSLELTKIRFVPDGSLICSSIHGQIFCVDARTGEIKKIYGEEQDIAFIYDFIQNGEKLYVTTDEGVRIYNMETTSQEPTETVLKDYFENSQKEEVSSTISISIIGYGAEIALMSGEDDNTLYFCDRQGLYRYVEGSSELERVINGELNSMSNQKITRIAILAKDNGGFLFLCRDIETYESQLLDYTFSEDAPAVPNIELKVYSLYDNANIRQAINLFQSRYPDYYVNFEAGVSNDNGITVSDALRTLNTSIMAGNGPDVMLMDGMPTDSYIEMELLTDLNGLLDEIKAENSYFERVLEQYSTDEGVYAVPTRFSMPVLMGREEEIENITDLKSLADAVEQWQQERDSVEPVWTVDAISELAELLLMGSASALTKEDGTIHEQNLHEFMEQLKRLWDSGKRELDEEEESYFIISGIEKVGNIQIQMVDILGGMEKVQIVNLESVDDFNMLAELTEQRDWSYKRFSGLSENNCVPKEIMGINAKSEKQEESKAFVRALLSEEIQKSATAGLPVNKNAFERLWVERIEQSDTFNWGGSATEIKEDGTEVEFRYMIEVQAEEDYRKFEKEIDSLMSPAQINNIVKDTIFENANRYISDDINLDEAIEAIQDTVNLYLAE